MEIEIAKIKWIGGYNYKSDKYNNFGIVESLEEKGKEYKIPKSCFGTKYEEMFEKNKEDSNFLKNYKIFIIRENASIKSVDFLINGGFKNFDFDIKMKIINLTTETDWKEYIAFFKDFELEKIIKEKENIYLESFKSICLGEVQIRKFIQSPSFIISEYLDLKKIDISPKRLEEVFHEKVSRIPSGEEKIIFISKNLKNEEINILLKKTLEIYVNPKNFDFFLENADLMSDTLKELFFDIIFSSNVNLDDQWDFFQIIFKKKFKLKNFEKISEKHITKLNDFMKVINEFNNFSRNISIQNLLSCLKLENSREKLLIEKFEKKILEKMTEYFQSLEDFESIHIWFEGDVVFKKEELNEKYDCLRKETLMSEKNVHNPFNQIEKLKQYLSDNKKPYVSQINTCVISRKNYFLAYNESFTFSENINFYNRIFKLFNNKKDSQYVEMLLFDHFNNETRKNFNYTFQLISTNSDNELDIFEKKFINKICLLTGMKKDFNDSKNKIIFSSTIDMDSNLALAKEIPAVPNSNILVRIYVVGVSNYSANHNMNTKNNRETEIKNGTIEISNVTTGYLEGGDFHKDLINLIPGYNRVWDKVNHYTFFYEFFDSNNLYKEGIWKIRGTQLLMMRKLNQI